MHLLRKLLFPFSLGYAGVMLLRNELYDRGVFKSKSYPFPVICIGNLSVGGTGKSPMVEYLIRLLKKDSKVATLSRGYKRSTKGFHLLTGMERASEVGDEPLQFKIKFPDILVAVDEVRTRGINCLMDLLDTPEVVILDDAFQHRKVSAGLNILLTSYDAIYAEDFTLPMGNLREPRIRAKRAQIIVVTKCPPDLDLRKRKLVKEKLALELGQNLFFSKITYDDEVFSSAGITKLNDFKSVSFTLVTGIANPKPLVEYLKQQGLDFDHLSFPDHHNFSTSEIEKLNKLELIITTEKDFMRLKGAVSNEKLFYLPIKTSFLSFQEKLEFDLTIETFVTKK